MKISIIIPTLDRPIQSKVLISNISLLLNRNVELIVIDDSKNPMELANLSKDIKYLHRGEKLGVCSARNYGASFAKGQYLLFLDDDDKVSEEWLKDFLAASKSEADMVFCDMITTKYGNGEKTLEKVEIQGSKLIKQIFIPGAWMIRNDFFQKIGGYDERLKYAENTELFMRAYQAKPKFHRIPKANFFYFPSIDGGSKNLRNMIDSLQLILNKHEDYLSNHVKFLYNQIIGVNYMRFRQYEKARICLANALKYKPYKMSTWIRLIIAWFPFLAKRIYTETVNPVK
ncbi:putative glycosyltransferase [Belliella baltica DSM 15883]|uniref:Putative glycosyltransferase n=1 Tax=Belliella baltica (strain DSM 15883 / CIP 108006 / LMG 21964 / BA134) TaxID=866536 RepID=I3Z760_BELBD|nr:glycosyltransferase family 2 protein [Belliella baltica]AFL85078.1 putative glycosyltransferase [Belliella baltica DSM 15883]